MTVTSAAHNALQILLSQKYTRGFCIITDCRMQLLYHQFYRFKSRINSQYHAKRNQALDAIIKDHQHQARVARISRPILPQSNKAEDLATWKSAQVLFVPFVSFVDFHTTNSIPCPPASNY